MNPPKAGCRTRIIYSLMAPMPAMTPDGSRPYAGPSKPPAGQSPPPPGPPTICAVRSRIPPCQIAPTSPPFHRRKQMLQHRTAAVPSTRPKPPAAGCPARSTSTPAPWPSPPAFAPATASLPPARRNTSTRTTSPPSPPVYAPQNFAATRQSKSMSPRSQSPRTRTAAGSPAPWRVADFARGSGSEFE